MPVALIFRKGTWIEVSMPPQGSLGNNIAPHKTRKNMIVWRKKPRGVGAPTLSAIVNNQGPIVLCVIRKVSGLATKKNMSVA